MSDFSDYQMRAEDWEDAGDAYLRLTREVNELVDKQEQLELDKSRLEAELDILRSDNADLTEENLGVNVKLFVAFFLGVVVTAFAAYLIP